MADLLAINWSNTIILIISSEVTISATGIFYHSSNRIAEHKANYKDPNFKQVISVPPKLKILSYVAKVALDAESDHYCGISALLLTFFARQVSQRSGAGISKIGSGSCSASLMSSVRLISQNGTSKAFVSMWGTLCSFELFDCRLVQMDSETWLLGNFGEAISRFRSVLPESVSKGVSIQP